MLTERLTGLIAIASQGYAWDVTTEELATLVALLSDHTCVLTSAQRSAVAQFVSETLELAASIDSRAADLVSIHKCVCEHASRKGWLLTL